MATRSIEVRRLQGMGTQCNTSAFLTLMIIIVSKIENEEKRLHFLALPGAHRLTTRISALTVTLVLVIRKAISLIISMISIVRVGRTIGGFISLASANICSVLGLDQSILWNLFELDFDVMFRSLGVPSSLNLEGLEEKRLQEVDMRLMWTGAALVLFGTIGYTIGSRPREEKSKQE